MEQSLSDLMERPHVMTMLMPALFFLAIGMGLVWGLAEMVHTNGDKMRAAWAGDSLASRGVADQVVVNVRWKSRGEARKTVVMATSRLGWRAAA